MESKTFQDEAVFNDLMTHHYTKMVRYTWILVRRMGVLEVGSNLVEDTVQEAVLQAWRYRDRLETVQDTLLWIYAALTLKLQELLRSERQWARCLQKMQLESDPEVLPVPDEWLDLHKTLSELPPEESRLLYLYFWEGYSYQELCRISGCSLTNMTTKMYRIRKKLKKKLESTKITDSL